MNLLSIYKKENYTLARKYEFYVLVTRTIPGLTREILSLPLKKLIFCRRRIKSSIFGFLMEVFWESSFSSDTWLQGWLELISVAQSAYRENHSTETVLPKVKNDIFVLLLIASTTGSYWRHSGYNLGGRVFKCLRSYLSGRNQRIWVCGRQPGKFKLKCGVPQGSCFEPLHLFDLATRCCSRLYSIRPLLHRRHPPWIPFSPAYDTGHFVTISACYRASVVLRRSGVRRVTVNYCWLRLKLTFFWLARSCTSPY